MKIIESIKEMQGISKAHRRDGKTIGFVPTMGYLHKGHLTLVQESRRLCDITIVSIFVNPLQFGPKEDLAKYPRDFEKDSQLLLNEGTDYIFFPPAEEMYPVGFQTYVDVDQVTLNLCGASRPGHFRGVTTVVNKLFNAVTPDMAFFGDKDFQQLAAIKRMVKDLNMDLEIMGIPIVREADGLAMSSRNTYLSREERQSALCLSLAIKEAQEMVLGGITDARDVLSKVERMIKETPHTRIDYVKLCNPETLTYIETGRLSGNTLLALAVFVGKTRLIDNAVLEVLRA
jgi:pantoate--beta-alanine ligase